jgi:hypothetical protein
MARAYVQRQEDTRAGRDKRADRHEGNDLPTHAPEKHLGIEVIRADQPLPPTLTPDAHQLDDRPEILSRRRQSVEMTFAVRLRYYVYDT